SVLDERNDVSDDERELRATAAAEPQHGATVTRAHPDHDDVHEWGALGVGAGWSCRLRLALGRSIEALDVDLLRGARVPRPGLAVGALEPDQPVRQPRLRRRGGLRLADRPLRGRVDLLDSERRV